MNSVLPSRQGGFSLITAIIFLVVLLLVSSAAIRGTTLEVKMSGNDLQKAQAFEASETPRMITSDLLDVHTFNRGWPTSVGGTISNTLFDYDMPTGLKLGDADNDSRPDNLYVGNTEAAFSPQALDSDATYQRSLTPTGQTPVTLDSSLSVFKLRTDIATGAGSAMVQGYEGLGKSSAAAGGNIFFDVRSTGTDPGGEARVSTAATYRHVIRN